eukprot:7332511-Alexandrium_andersonii.AAC.1
MLSISAPGRVEGQGCVRGILLHAMAGLAGRGQVGDPPEAWRAGDAALVHYTQRPSSSRWPA